MIIGWIFTEGFRNTMVRYAEHYDVKQWRSVVAHSFHGSFVFAITVIMIVFFSEDPTAAHRRRVEKLAADLDGGAARADDGAAPGDAAVGVPEYGADGAESPSAKDRRRRRCGAVHLFAAVHLLAIGERARAACGTALAAVALPARRVVPALPPAVAVRLRAALLRAWEAARGALGFLAAFLSKAPSQREAPPTRWADFQRSPWVLCAWLANSVPWLVYAPTYNRYTLAPSLCAWIQIFPGPAALVTTLAGTTQCYTTFMAVLVEGKVHADMSRRQSAYAYLIQIVGLSAAITKGGVLSVPRCTFDAHQTFVETSISLTLVLVLLIELRERTWDGLLCFALTAVAVAGCITFDQCFCTFYAFFEILGNVVQINYLAYRVARKIRFDAAAYAMQVLLLNLFSWLLNQILLSFCIHHGIDFNRIGGNTDGMPDRLHQVRADPRGPPAAAAAAATGTRRATDARRPAPNRPDDAALGPALLRVVSGVRTGRGAADREPARSPAGGPQALQREAGSVPGPDLEGGDSLVALPTGSPRASSSLRRLLSGAQARSALRARRRLLRPLRHPHLLLLI